MRLLASTSATRPCSSKPLIAASRTCCCAVSSVLSRLRVRSEILVLDSMILAFFSASLAGSLLVGSASNAWILNCSAAISALMRFWVAWRLRDSASCLVITPWLSRVCTSIWRCFSAALAAAVADFWIFSICLYDSCSALSFSAKPFSIIFRRSF